MLNRSRLSWKDPSHLPIKTTHDHFTSGVWKQKSIEGLLEKSRAGRGKTKRRPTTTRGKVELRMNGTGNSDFRARQVPVQCSALSSPHSVSRTCWWVLRKQHETRRNFTAGRKSEEPFLSTRDSTATLCSARSLSLIVVHRQLLGGCCGLEIYGKSRCWVE